MTTTKRKQQLDELEKFIQEAKSNVNFLLKELGWDIENTVKNTSNLSGPKSESDSTSDENDPLYPKSIPWKHSVTLDKNTIKHILPNRENGSNVPNKFSETQVQFSREEKLLLYEYVVGQTGKLCEPELTVLLNPEDGQREKLTFAEIVALRRDLKRRRLKYRVTKVPPLSNTEELRNLIDLQMQALTQYLQVPEGNNQDVREVYRSQPGTSTGMPIVHPKAIIDCKIHKSSRKLAKSKSKEDGERHHKKKKSRDKSRKRKKSYSSDDSRELKRDNHRKKHKRHE